MLPETNELVQRITRPLEANAELHLAAQSYLLERLKEAGNDNKPPAECPGLNSLAIPPKPWRRWFYLACAAVILAMATPLVWPQYEAWRLSERKHPDQASSSNEHYTPFKLRKLTVQDRILLFGDESLEFDAAEKWKPLWKLEPDNPVFLAHYAKSYSYTKKPLSPEILDTAARIDPENALYPMLQATIGCDSVIESQFVSRKDRKAGTKKKWIIKDDAQLQSRIELIHRALAMPALCGYEMEMRSRQGMVLPQPKDFNTLFESASFKSYLCAWFSFQPASNLLAAKASECASQGDTEGFRAAVSTWKALCRMAASGGKSFLDALIIQSILSNSSKDFSADAQKLGLEDDVQCFGELDQYFKHMRADEKSGTHRLHPSDKLLQQKGHLFFSNSSLMMRSRAKNPPPITENDLRPGRYADHALFGRFLALGSAVIFVLLAGAAALCRYRQSAIVRAFSPVMTGLLRVSDGIWIIGLGVLVPISGLLIIQFFTPLAAREWSLAYTQMIQPSAQFGAALLLVLVTSLATAGWRLGLRGAAFGLRGKHSWIGWTMAAITFLAIPAIGILPQWPATVSVKGHGIALGVLLGAPALWLGISLLFNLINQAPQSLRRATIARLMIPAWMFAAAAFACLIPLYHQAEKYGFQNDHLSGLADPAQVFNRYEMELAKVLLKELQDLMDGHF